MDDELRRRARSARAEVEARVDVESELADRPAAPEIAPVVPLAPRRRLMAVAGSVAAVAVAVVAGFVLLRGSDSIETSEPTIDATTSITSATPPTTPPTTLPGVTTTVVPTTSLPGTTTTTNPSAVTSVSYLDPPPAASLTRLGVLDVPEPETGAYQVAIGDLGVAVSSGTYDATSGAHLDIVAFDGTIRSFDGVPYDNVIAYGPGDVVYTTVGQAPDDFAVAAIPVSGDRAGETVATEPANVLHYLEYPPASYGHAASGVSLRRYQDEIAIGYVDRNGSPTMLQGAPPFFDSDPQEVEDGDMTVRASTGTSWTLSISTHPDGASPYVGPSPAAPTTNGDGVLWTHIGPDLAPDVDFGEPSQWVVAQLHPDGSTTWWSLPDGWTIAASDIWGTVAVRQDGEQLEVALVEFARDEPSPTTTTTTVTTSTTTTTVDTATTIPTGAVSWQSLPWEAAGIERNCRDDDVVGCTQILVDRDGSLVTYDPTDRTVTRHTSPPVTARIDDELGLVYLQLLGPDQVVYLNVDAATPGDGAADLLAIALAAGDAGRELGRWVGVTDRVGDTDLVATRDGLVVVGCCDHERRRPAPDAEVVLRWVGRDGGDASISGPVMRSEVALATLTVHRDDDLPAGTRSWTFEPPDDWQPRGMPTVIPTFDGGFVAGTFGLGQTVIRGWVDGTIDMVTLETFTDGTVAIATLDPSGRAIIGDGERFARFEPLADRTQFWDGRPATGDDGSVTLPDIDTPIDAGAPWARNPITFGNAVAGRMAVNEYRTIAYQRASDFEFVVTVTTANFFDDSVYAARLDLTLERDDDGRFRFASGTWSQACQPGRGHQDFSAEFCI